MNQFKRYLPLFVVLMIAVLMALALNQKDFSLFSFMNQFMGLFLCLLAMFKLFDINGFANGFQKYDLIAMRARKYAYAYPFIELGLGLGFLAQTFLILVNAITIAVMSLAAIGVIKKIGSGMNIQCACLGTVLRVPLSTVSVVENCSMAAMAAINLIALL